MEDQKSKFVDCDIIPPLHKFSYNPRYVKSENKVYISAEAYQIVQAYTIYTIEDFATFVRYHKHWVAKKLGWKLSQVHRANQSLFNLLFKISNFDWYTPRDYQRTKNVKTEPERTERMLEKHATFELADGTQLPRLFPCE